jgi:hypothetical protein
MKGGSQMWFDRFLSSPVHEKVEENPVPVQHNVENFEFKAAVSFTSDESRKDGQCLSMSDSGLVAAFEHPPEPWTDGQLAMTVLEQPVNIPARVARVNGQNVGFSFLIHNNEELAFITALIASILNPPSEGDPSGETTDTPSTTPDQAVSVSGVS